MFSNNLTMMTDLYELTMMQGYFFEGNEDKVVFDVFYRKNPSGSAYAITCGLDQVIDYIKNLSFSYEDIDYLRGLGIFKEDFLSYLAGFHFSGDIYAIPEGSVVFPKEPLVKVIAPIMEAQLVETAILNIINHQSLIATKASRVDYAAGGGVMEFGLRRAQGPDANSWIMSFPDELTAFRTYAKMYPDACILLVDTYDTLKSGVPHAIQVFKEMRDAGITSKLMGIRLDSGDIAYLSKKARKMLDEAGFTNAIISASSDLDEYLINSLKTQGCTVTSWGVGTNLITSSDNPAFGGVYKLAAIKKPGDKEFTAKIKISENPEKITNPGNKTVYRIYDKESSKIKADLICLVGETFDPSEDLKIFDPISTWKKSILPAGSYQIREMLVPIFLNGQCVYSSPAVMDIKAYCQQELNTLWDENRRLINPQTVYVDLSQKLFDLKHKLLGDEK